MNKTIILVLSIFFTHFTYASDQIIVVDVVDVSKPNATLTKFTKENGIWEKFGKTHEVVVGRNGIAKGLGTKKLLKHQSMKFKKEGDGKSPAGIFNIKSAYGYAESPPEEAKLPYQMSDENLRGVDDVESKYYNQIVSLAETKKDWKSQELIKRKDHLYKWLITIGHNPDNKPHYGSLIFFHIWRKKGKGTAGCVAMEEANILKLFSWLDPKKDPVVLITTQFKLTDLDDIP